jgi:exodeoxyribonuclease VII small subunit
MDPAKQNFEESLAELEAIAVLLERGQPALDESLAKFERGVVLLRSLRGMLDQAEGRIRQFVEVDEAGVARLRDFEHEATHAPAKKKKTREAAPEPRVEPPESGLFGG